MVFSKPLSIVHLTLCLRGRKLDSDSNSEESPWLTHNPEHPVSGSRTQK